MSNNAFTNHGIPSYSRVNRLATVSILFAYTPLLGNVTQVDGLDPNDPDFADGIPQYALIRADGKPATSGDTAVGVTNTPILASEIQAAIAAGQTFNLPYYASGNFVFEGLALDPSLNTLALARATVNANNNILINSHELSQA